MADSVEAAKLSGAGVAMRLNVSPAAPVMGQIALGGTQALGTKIVNGHRYVLVTTHTGSALGPRWVEEGIAAAQPTNRVTIDDPAFIKSAPMGNAR